MMNAVVVTARAMAIRRAKHASSTVFFHSLKIFDKLIK